MIPYVLETTALAENPMYVIAEMDEASDVAKCMEVLIKVGFRRLFVFEDLFVAASTLHKGKRNTDIERQSVSLGNGDVNLQSTSQNFFPSECYQFTNGQKSSNTNDIDVKIEDESDSIRSDFSSSSVQELDHDQSGNGKRMVAIVKMLFLFLILCTQY
uniref:ACT domain-containing protein n=1 Tax=Heterorhabditis bacteriophora TaxID=37862 RepID=A0A1I7WYT3_HETBA